MSQKPSSLKHVLSHPIKTTNCQRTDLKLTRNNTEHLVKTAIDNGNDIDHEMLIETENYWKLIAEQRQQAIKETMSENQQLHSMINELSKQNDKLRLIANLCDS